MQEVLFFSLCLTSNVCDRVGGGLCSVRVGVGQWHAWLGWSKCVGRGWGDGFALVMWM